MNSEYDIQQPKSGSKKIILLLAALLITAAVVTVVYYTTKVTQPASSESRQVEFKIEKGTSTKTVARQLGDAKIISRPWVFEAYARFHGVGGKLQAGSYMLDPNMAIPEIVDILTAGRVVSDSRTVTVIEGWSNDQMAASLSNRQIISSEEELAQVLSETEFEFAYNDIARELSYEGFLFPDTYTLGRNEDLAALVQKMLTNFESKLTAEMLSDIEASGRTLKDVITLASIIEKEVGRNKSNLTDQDIADMQRERDLVASVFYNRLEVGMGLESDATVNYITGKKDRSVTIADTKIDSPYNTYRYRGLPPGPIGNPGIDSIRAAINPAQSDYLFFLHSPEGVAYFGKTLEEHNENREKYLR